MAPPWARAVLEIQAVDLRIRDMKTRLGLLPKERRRIADAKKAIDVGLDVFKNEIKQYEMVVRKAESEIAELEESIRKNQQQSSLVKKNTEYQAMLAAVEMSRQRISKLESVVLENFDKIETAKTNLKKAQSEAQATVKSLKAEWMEFDELERDIKSEQQKMLAERDRLRGLLPTALGEEYDNLFNANDGTPLVPVEEGGICGHCFLKITPQTLNRASAGAIVDCDNCRHLIYMEDAQ